MSARSSLAISLLFLAACSRSGGTGDQAKRDEPLRVAAASDLSIAFPEVGKAFEARTGKKVEFNFGSSGLLSKQIREGAPFDVFAAANVQYVDDVVKTGTCLVDTKRIYARGHLVVWAKDEQHLPAKIEDLADPKYAKLAIANPEHAPYGKAAKQALEKSGVWASAEPRAVLGENVQQTLMFARSGNADVALVGLSIAITTPGKYFEIDPSLYDPLDQAMAACRGPNGGKTNEAKQFVDFVGSDAGRAIMRKYGFLLPGESLPR
ncbi:MAG TPA: molybdate ABC transporter substrate-binding protein [Labilithrix sp.]